MTRRDVRLLRAAALREAARFGLGRARRRALHAYVRALDSALARQPVRDERSRDRTTRGPALATAPAPEHEGCYP